MKHSEDRLKVETRLAHTRIKATSKLSKSAPTISVFVRGTILPELCLRREEGVLKGGGGGEVGPVLAGWSRWIIHFTLKPVVVIETEQKSPGNNSKFDNRIRAFCQVPNTGQTRDVASGIATGDSPVESNG
ncbi:hypothetical protein BaRGS_00006744 [Batillaria attramentaria]|uniref:Uncharacterized protein n=1 Tax=Batillaria attramentaria TaxID=370345 RepID=A0ABD0LRB8_9CAEN